jgi:hypothetical protein
MQFCLGCGVESKKERCPGCVRFEREQREIEANILEEYMEDMEYYGGDSEPSIYDLNEDFDPELDAMMQLQMAAEDEWEADTTWNECGLYDL